MDEDNIKHMLHQLGVPMQRYSFTGSAKHTRWLNVSCPFAPFTHAKGSDSNPSFGITISEDGRSYYKCLSCNMKGRLSALPTKLGGYRKKDYRKLRHWAEMAELQASIAKPTVDWEDDRTSEARTDGKQTDTKLPDPALVREYPTAMGIPYLRERGLSFPTPLKLNLRYDDYQHRVLFPCYDRFDRFRGFTGRSVLPADALSKRNPKVRDYYGLNKRELFLGLPGSPKGKKLLSEGLIDYAKSIQYGYNAARAILGTSLTPEKIDILISEGDPVYFFMDNDLAGWQALFGVFDEEGELNTENSWVYNLYKELPVWIVPYPTPLDGTDPGSLSREEFNKCVDSAWLFMGKPPMDDLDQPHLMLPGSV